MNSIAIAEVESGTHRGQKKSERYQWRIVDEPGQMMMVRIDRLNVDHDYQRKNVSNLRVINFASEWSWQACLVIGVARRQDGTLWVYEGQTRVLAARKRGDIEEMPCIVFDVKEIKEEARAFHSANTNRGAVRSIDKFRALLKAEDLPAMQVANLVSDWGLTIGTGNGQVKCVQRLMDQFKSDPILCKRCFAVCLDLTNGEVHDHLFQALCVLDKHIEKHMGKNISHSEYSKKLADAGFGALNSAMSKAIDYHGKTGAKVWAEGLLKIINSGKRSLRVPALVTVGE